MTRSWWENEAILKQFGEWLSQTAEEIEDLDDASAISLADAASGAEASSSDAAAVGLLQVVEALTAMRHELKLQTKSSRGLEATVDAARQGLDEAMRQFRSVQAREEESAARAALPLVETLAGLDEALWRVGKAFEATHRQMTEMAPQRVRQMVYEELQRLPAWRRWLLGAWPAHLEQHCAATVASINAEEFTHLLNGYRLIQDRIQQELQRQGLRRIDAVGRRVDPTCMMVVAIADNSEGLPETAVEELRLGYRWRDKVIRFAEVRAVASQEGGTTGLPATTQRDDQTTEIQDSKAN